MTAPLRLGLIGAGRISRAHIRAYNQHRDRIEVVAVADVNEAAGAAAQQALGGGRLYADWRALLEDAAVEAVDVCLPHDLHREVCVAAAELGKHVLVEKPIARTLAEAEAMVAAAERAGVVLMVCHDRRYHPLFATIKEVLDAAGIGRLLCLRLDHNQYIRLTPQDWIFQRHRLGGGAIMSCLVHQLDLIRWYGGDLAQVGCVSLTLPDRMEGEIIGIVPLRFSSGAVGDTVINWHMQTRGLPGGLWSEHVWVSGAEGNLHTGPTGEAIHVLRDGAAAANLAEPAGYQTVPHAAGTGHVGAIAHFADCVRSGSTPLTNGRDSLLSLEAALAAYAAEESGRFIDLPLTPEGRRQVDGLVAQRLARSPAAQSARSVPR